MAQGTAVKTLDRPEPTALGEMVNAELSNQIATAKKYPRDEEAALRQLEKLATRSDAIAEQCMYTLKRTQKGKNGARDEIVFITGPSVHFMQLLAYCWGNMRAAARIVEEGEKTVTAQGLAYDLQRNNGLLVEIKRGIATSSGYRFSQDMINVTSNAACSIAERNAIEDCIPRVLWWEVYEAVKAKAVGAAQIPERIGIAVKYFISQGAKQDDILAAMGVGSLADMGREHLEIFIGLRAALKEGGITADKIFTAEGAEQRKRLSLTDEDDPAAPGTRVTPIDGLLGNPKPDETATPSEPADKKKGGTSAKKAAQKARGEEAPETADTPEANASDAAAGSAEAAKDDGDDGEADREDAALVASIEAKLDPAKALSTRKAVNEHRGALARIAELGSDELKSRAAKILTDWPAK